MPERQPNYQPKHETQISLDQYRGVASDLMTVNAPVADGFMCTSDMRRNIVIAQKPEGRAVEYDQVGHVKVGKLFRMPRFGEDLTPGLRTVSRDNDSWYILVDDQLLARRVAENPKGTEKFDQTFTTSFQHEVRRGIEEILFREKMLGEGDSLSWIWLCYTLTLAIPVAGYAFATQGQPIGPVETLAEMLKVNTILNGSALVVSELFRAARMRYLGLKTPTPPFTRSSPLEIPLPLVPVDRFGRGLWYLYKHGNNLIEKEE